MTQLTPKPKPCITVEDFKTLLSNSHPFAASMNVEILEIGYGSALLLLPDSGANQRMGGIVAGPMLMGLADLALYAAIVGATGNTNAVTASLSINFLRKAPKGGILAKTQIVKTGRLAAGEVTMMPAAGGDPVAHVISTWSLPRPQ